MVKKTTYKQIEETTTTAAEPVLDYIPAREVEKEEKKKKLGFNDLTPTEWALLSKNVITEDDLFNPVWNDLSSPRNEYQKEHGAVFPVKLAERLIKMYSKEGDTVFDPFMGIGSTAIAAHNLGRHAVGIELNPKFATIANNWLNDVNGLFSSDMYYKIVNDDCRNMLQHVREDKIQVTVTSPPYVGLINYHEQQAYAYDLFGFNRNDELEIGPLYKGQKSDAQQSYIEDISEVLNNCKQYMVDDYDVFLVANDKYNLYPTIADKAEMQIVE